MSPGAARAGFSLLEVQVAFVLLGIALAGVCPLVVMQVRLSRRVVADFDRIKDNGTGPRFDDRDDRVRPRTRMYLVPPPDRWARKLGAPAALTRRNPGGPPVVPAPSPDAKFRMSRTGPILRNPASTAVAFELERVPLAPPDPEGTTP